MFRLSIGSREALQVSVMVKDKPLARYGIHPSPWLQHLTGRLGDIGMLRLSGTQP
jgi:hypothetical protein